MKNAYRYFLWMSGAVMTAILAAMTALAAIFWAAGAENGGLMTALFAALTIVMAKKRYPHPRHDQGGPIGVVIIRRRQN